MATQSAFETQIQAEQQAYLQEVEAEMARFFYPTARDALQYFTRCTQPARSH